MHSVIAFSIVLSFCFGSACMDDFDEINYLQNEKSSLQQNVNQECDLHQKPVDCAEIFENGLRKSGIYEVYPKSKNLGCSSFKVYCDMETDGGGWTVIQRRGDFKRPIDYFYKTWKQYKEGFGSLRRDFWLGNDNIHALTYQKRYSARFDLGTDNETAHALYNNFWIEDEDFKYKLHITDYSGTAGDSMSHHNNGIFSTKDQEAGPRNCAKVHKGGWWYQPTCYKANLNGLYLKGYYKEKMWNATIWGHWKDFYVSLSTVEIKIRPNDY
ncbi:techylectin-5A-like [Parasteatoda tepidariorum]|uniref:techylectin-5A-like n=1 Tax=Parasteatoda tepidariorum TaxID=114398 RepID=UPI0039BC2436